MQISSQIITINVPTSNIFTSRMPFLSPNQQSLSKPLNTAVISIISVIVIFVVTAVCVEIRSRQLNRIPAPTLPLMNRKMHLPTFQRRFDVDLHSGAQNGHFYHIICHTYRSQKQTSAVL